MYCSTSDGPYEHCNNPRNPVRQTNIYQDMPISLVQFYQKVLLLYLDLTLTCKAVCCAIFNKLHHHIFVSCELTQGGA